MDFDIRVRSLGKAKIKLEDRLSFDHARRRKADFSGQKLGGFAAVGSRFERCRFDKMRIESGGFGVGKEQSEYVECTFDGSRITFGPGGFARYVRCSFRDVDLRDWFCFAVELVDCTFSGRMRRSWFNGTVPEEDRSVVGRERNEFRGNDFSEMDLIDVGFRTGIDLTQQRLPSDSQYIYLPNGPEAVQRAREEVIAWENLDLRREVMALIKVLEEEVHSGQRQFLLRPDSFFRRRHEVEAVSALFRPHPSSDNTSTTPPQGN